MELIRQRLGKWGKTLLALTLTLGLIPSAAFANPTSTSGYAGASQKTDHSTSASSDLVAGTYVEGEALVIYRDSSASNTRMRASNAPSPLSEEGFAVEETWDLSAPDAAESIQPFANGLESSNIESGTDATTLPKGSDLRIALVAKEGMSTADLIAQLESLDCVEAVAPNYTRSIIDDASSADASAGASNASTAAASGTSSSPSDSATASYTASNSGNALFNDTFYNRLYGLNKEAGINLSAALEYEKNSGTTVEPNIVAVLDLGVDYSNPDLENVMWENPGNIGLPGNKGSHGYDYGDNDDDPMPNSAETSSHGTHCAGIIAAEGNNNEGIAGVAQHTEIMALKLSTDENTQGIFGDVELISSYNYVIQAAVAGENVVAINGSWGVGNYSPVLDYVINQAGKAGVVSFLAAGNEYSYLEDSTGYGTTAGLESPYAIIVAASNPENTLSDFSNHHETMVDIAAPGASILSTIAGSASDAWFDASLSHQAGKDLSYYSDLGELADLATAGEAKVSIVDTIDDEGGRIENPDSDIVSLKKTSDGKLAVTLNTSKINNPDDDGEAHEYKVAIEWQIKNPFYGTDIDPSQYGASVFLELVDGAKLCDAEAAMVGASTGTTFIPRQKVTANVDNGGITQAVSSLTDACKNDEKLNVTLLVSAAPNTSGTDASCIVSGLGFGLKSEAYVPYGYMNGTSMATPMAAGAFAELASIFPKESPLDLRGRIVGGTTPLGKSWYMGILKHIATEGRFTFDNALDESKINANTWAASVDEETHVVTLHGRALDGAQLTVDGTLIGETTVSDDGTSLSFVADESLFDSAQHRFDVTDENGRVHNASYRMPLIEATPEEPAASDELVKLGDLPEAAQDSGSGMLVSAGESLMYIDRLGTFAYLMDITAEAPTWKEIAAPGMDFLQSAGADDALRKTLMTFTYADGMVYAFGFDSVTHENSEGGPGIAVFASRYDMNAGTWDSFEEVARTAPENGSLAISRTLFATSYKGKIYLGFTANVRKPMSPDIDDDDEVLLPKVNFYTLSAPTGSKDFSLSARDITGATYAPISFVTGNQSSLGLLRADDTATYLSWLQDDGTWSDENIALGGLSFGEEGGAGDQQQASDFAFAPFAVSGVGVLCAGYTAPNKGDVLSLGVEEGTWKGIGSYGARLADGFVFQSVAMVGNTPYIAALQTPDDGTSSTLGALYTLPDAAAAQLGTLTRTATAVAQQGGTATVADWREGSAQSVAMTAHDSATWEAAPAEGCRFVGWYEGETLISSEATYKTPVLFDTVLSARFAPIETAGTPNSEGAGASDGEALADTGDAMSAPTLALAGLALLSCAAIALSVVRRRCSE